MGPGSTATGGGAGAGGTTGAYNEGGCGGRGDAAHPTLAEQSVANPLRLRRRRQEADDGAEQTAE